MVLFFVHGKSFNLDVVGKPKVILAKFSNTTKTTISDQRGYNKTFWIGKLCQNMSFSMFKLQQSGLIWLLFFPFGQHMLCSLYCLKILRLSMVGSLNKLHN